MRVSRKVRKDEKERDEIEIMLQNSSWCHVFVFFVRKVLSHGMVRALTFDSGEEEYL